MIRAEWRKFRTVPGWVAGMAAAALVVIGLGLLAGVSVQQSCMAGNVDVRCPTPPTGPDGEAVQDHFTFVHRELTGDGELSARVSDFTGTITYPPPNHDEIISGLTPWSKAGIMIKSSAEPGSPYASVLLSGAHGVRMQYGFTHDIAGPDLSGTAWLRLTRHGDQITGYASADGRTWHEVARMRLDGLPATVRIGLFVASPSGITDDASPHGGHSTQARFTQAVADFSQVSSRGAWAFSNVGDDGHRTDWEQTHPPGYTEADGTLKLTGAGDIAPLTIGDGLPAERILTGVYIALLVVVVVAALFGTSEFRRGMIRTTLIASPNRVRVVVAKTSVIAAVGFAVGLVAAVVTLPVGGHLLRANGVIILAVSSGTTVRVVLGTALLVALCGVFAFGLGFFLRRALATVAVVATLLILPPLLALTSVLPLGAAEWLLRVTPAAGFAIQQTVPAYSQLAEPQSTAEGYFPLSPWAGLGVLLLYAALTVAAASWRLKKADG